MSPEKIKELREKFYKECTDRNGRLIPITSDNVFQWKVDNVIKAKEENPKINFCPECGQWISFSCENDWHITN